MSTRAYSKMELKAVDESSGKRLFTGIASTVSTDRMSDIVEPKGMVATLPTPLLWQHDSKQPIGWVTAARVSAKQIEVDCEIANIDEPGPLKDRLDMAWQSIKSKLVRGLSIGFNALESARIEGTYGLRYLSWELLELSAVTVPANSDCSITSIKAIDTQTRAALGLTRKGVVYLDAGAAGNNLPGASGKKDRRPGAVYLSN
ncbi:HK97 family phage prohead protease [Variovorax sp. Varisp41]|uniref:HK97 family phage prohead protease n=1 Tax=Variovorax sp. Varisp41 TaxID=3243033 RepID=UPI0039B4D01F